jgi:hypothetical protein
MEETFSWNEEIPPVHSLQVLELSQAVKRWLLITWLPEPIIGSLACLARLWFKQISKNVRNKTYPSISARKSDAKA